MFLCQINRQPYKRLNFTYKNNWTKAEFYILTKLWFPIFSNFIAKYAGLFLWILFRATCTGSYLTPLGPPLACGFHHNPDDYKLIPGFYFHRILEWWFFYILNFGIMFIYKLIYAVAQNLRLFITQNEFLHINISI